MLQHSHSLTDSNNDITLMALIIETTIISDPLTLPLQRLLSSKAQGPKDF